MCPWGAQINFIAYSYTVAIEAWEALHGEFDSSRARRKRMFYTGPVRRVWPATEQYERIDAHMRRRSLEVAAGGTDWKRCERQEREQAQQEAQGLREEIVREMVDTDDASGAARTCGVRS